MIMIYNKTAKDIAEEQALYDFGAQVVKGTPKRVCPTFVIIKGGARVDTCDLTARDIVSLISDDLKDPKSNGADASKLLRLLQTTWKPTYDDVLQLYQLENVSRSTIRDIMGTLRIKIVEDAYTIARFQKDSMGDFRPVTNEDEIAIIEQMKQHAIDRQTPRGNAR